MKCRCGHPPGRPSLIQTDPLGALPSQLLLVSGWVSAVTQSHSVSQYMCKFCNNISCRSVSHFILVCMCNVKKVPSDLPFFLIDSSLQCLECLIVWFEARHVCVLSCWLVAWPGALRLLVNTQTSWCTLKLFWWTHRHPGAHSGSLCVHLGCPGAPPVLMTQLHRVHSAPCLEDQRMLHVESSKYHFLVYMLEIEMFKII